MTTTRLTKREYFEFILCLFFATVGGFMLGCLFTQGLYPLYPIQ